MKNITLSIDDDLLREGREYARRHHTTLNSLVREVLGKTVRAHRSSWLGEAFAMADKARGNSRGARWKRDDLHAR
jgi:hypothetical protein